jgi:hypothetical protein
MCTNELAYRRVCKTRRWEFASAERPVLHREQRLDEEGAAVPPEVERDTRRLGGDISGATKIKGNRMTFGFDSAGDDAWQRWSWEE